MLIRAEVLPANQEAPFSYQSSSTDDPDVDLEANASSVYEEDSFRRSVQSEDHFVGPGLQGGWKT